MSNLILSSAAQDTSRHTWRTVMVMRTTARPFCAATTLPTPPAIWVERSEGDPSCSLSKRLPGAEGPPEGCNKGNKIATANFSRGVGLTGAKSE